eukprot:comp20366_c0_seq1/m.40743 comp20366_c0_seq1/g.40743  ORF comp20366_c0_seq1/g.40743 comp20366_c0_seq1/m.40743 type:complete len:318 (+) comp20366_c0_seq1:51-1004(+)
MVKNNSAIGIMDGAFFVSRGELLEWLNSLLGITYTKIEQVSTGAALCQVMDCIFPGAVRLSKVNFNAKSEYDSIKNFKVLQDAFTRMEVDKHIDVDKLIKGKYQDNLEFTQWFKKFFDLNYKGQPYDAVLARKNAGIEASSGSKASTSASPAKTREPAPAAAAAAEKETAAEAKPAKKEAVKKAMPARVAAGEKSVAEKPAPAEPTKENNPPRKGLSAAPARAGAAAAGNAANTPASAQTLIAEEKVRQLNETIAEISLAKAGLEKERDFYFGKLRDIEIFCQTRSPEEQESPMLKQIFSILYATEDDFVQAEAATA